MDDPTQPPSRSWFWPVTLATLPIFYFLSSGPMIYLDARHFFSQSVADGLTTFYGPIGWLEDNTPAKGAVEAWESWWEGLADKH
jgi:hypothetical protein